MCAGKIWDASASIFIIGSRATHRFWFSASRLFVAVVRKISPLLFDSLEKQLADLKSELDQLKKDVISGTVKVESKSSPTK